MIDWGVHHRYHPTIMSTKEIRQWFQIHHDYNPMTGHFTNRESGVRVNQRHPKGYLVITGPRKKSFFAHRVAYLIMEGEWPDQIDHANRVRDDNRWDNLRNADQFLNAQNHSLRKTNTSGVTGVYRRGDNWTAELQRNGKRIKRHGYPSMEEAIAARAEFLLMLQRGETDGFLDVGTAPG